MAKKPLKKEQLQREYDRQIRRIAKRLDALEAQGYKTEYTYDKIEAIPKRITDATIRKLKNITPKWIREHSAYEDYHTGEIVMPKSVAAKKYIVKVENFEQAPVSTGNTDWTIERPSAEPSAEQLQQAYDRGYADAVEDYTEDNTRESTVTPSQYHYTMDRESVSEMIIDNFYGDLEGFPRTWVEYAHQKFDDAIRRYGKEKVAQALASMPESFHTFVNTHKYPSDDYVEAYYEEFLNYLDLSDDEYADADAEQDDYYV